MLALTATLAVALVVVAGLHVRLHRQVRCLAARAQAMVDGGGDALAPPQRGTLLPIARALAAAVDQARRLADLHAQRAEALRAQADLDPSTGVARRAAFLAQVAARLDAEDGPAAGALLLVRLADLASLNRMQGRATADRALRVIAQLLQAYPVRVRGCLVGRLNGADFALLLPAPGLAAETAASIADALRPALAAVAHRVHVHIGAAGFVHGTKVSDLLARADHALAVAESGAPFAIEVTQDGPSLGGEQDWHRRIEAALEGGRAQLGMTPMLDERQQVVVLDTALRLRLAPDGPFEAGALWRPLARRSGLVAQADLLALTLALDATERDGLARRVTVATGLLCRPDGLARLRPRLQARGDAAGRLWLGVVAADVLDAGPGATEALREMLALLKPLGLRVGLVQAGMRMREFERLAQWGLDFVTLDAALASGVSSDARSGVALRALLDLLHALGVTVLAEGIEDDRDARWLFEAGVAAVGGAWARSRA
jgi:predicted signal transduction protein with EAL and GGDEF domain